MNVGVLRIGFAIFWLAIAGMILVYGIIDPAEWADRIGSSKLNLGFAISLALVAWNLVRWYIGRKRVVRQIPIPPRQIPDRKDEYIPELDFTRPPTDV